MKPGLLTAEPFNQLCTLSGINPISCRPSSVPIVFLNPQFKSPGFFTLYCSHKYNVPISSPAESSSDSLSQLRGAVGSPIVPPSVAGTKLSLSDQAFFLLAFIACTTSIAFTSLVIAAVPTLCAMARAARSLSKLADTAREELPSTMAAIRLSGMEISDLTLELNDLSQEIADGVNKSAQVVQAAEAGVRQIGSLARQQTMSMIQERADLPVISIQPVVAGAAKKTSDALGQATKKLMGIIYGGESSSDKGNKTEDRLDI